MRQADPAVRNLARRLLAHEAGSGGQGLEALADAAERACEKLRLHLSKILGQAGFQALLARALTLATAEFSWLTQGRAERDGSLTGLRAAAEGRNPAEATAGFAAVLGHILGLLVVFIGDDLTGRLVRQVWPEAEPGESVSPGSEDEAEGQR
jgi:hypothetical protein